MSKKVIVTDCDGVLLDWEEGFGVWMEHNGHNMVPDGKLIYNIAERYGMDAVTGKQMVKQFNQSAAMGFLPPLRDAQYYVKTLVREASVQVPGAYQPELRPLCQDAP